MLLITAKGQPWQSNQLLPLLPELLSPIPASRNQIWSCSSQDSNSDDLGASWHLSGLYEISAHKKFNTIYKATTMKKLLLTEGWNSTEVLEYRSKVQDTILKRWAPAWIGHRKQLIIVCQWLLFLLREMNPQFTFMNIPKHLNSQLSILHSRSSIPDSCT